LKVESYFPIIVLLQFKSTSPQLSAFHFQLLQGKEERNFSIMSNEQTKNPVVTIEMEDGGVITAELYPDVAPNTVNNFISLINKGYYDGLIFHRVIPGFMLQGGCPQGEGFGGPGYGIRGEFKQIGVENDLKHSRGVLSMARSSAPNSAGSQFFIVHEDSSHLDGSYAAFGCVTGGMDVVDAIAEVSTDMRSDRPDKDQRMAKVTVETFGIEYPEPEKM
jgi:peptidyl-prolyl cis-trans isomerase B (cyclophilin B)